jgi:hypothetical protein
MVYGIVGSPALEITSAVGGVVIMVLETSKKRWASSSSHGMVRFSAALAAKEH